ncbi:hypothetical protein CK203_104025 [Vitis vinifera]|uniref:Uncharacterized protein n=1 Tax=Vitis vinifera TaxID=29760 RepID=A0A438FFS0_VITVI|nr:hypothetical protein CK203_104025 [Vitis vinifera]
MLLVLGTPLTWNFSSNQGAIGARHIAEALHIPYEPVTQADFREWSSFSQRDMVRILSRGTSTTLVLTRRELPFGMLLIDVLLRANIFHFSIKESPSEEASKGRCHSIIISEAPLSDFRAPGQFWRAPLERRRHCREDFSLNKWHHLAAYFAPQGALAVPPPQEAPVVPPPQEAPDVPPPLELPQDEQLPQAQQDEILTNTTPPAPVTHTSMHMLEATLPASPITQPAPPRLSALIADPEHRSGFSYPADGHYSCTPGSDHCYSDPAYHDPSSDPAASEYVDTSWHDRSGPSEPPVPDEEIIPAEQPIPDEEIRAEPSHDPTTI